MMVQHRWVGFARSGPQFLVANDWPGEESEKVMGFGSKGFFKSLVDNGGCCGLLSCVVMGE